MADFETRDPTSTRFWDERFEKNFTPWDKGDVPGDLQRFVRHSERPLATLIPGCGNAYEAAFLAQQAWQVMAIDFSPAAVQSARAAIGEWGKHVVEADFFKFTPQFDLDLIYERAFFCALPPEMRPAIVARWAELLPTGGLLAGFVYFNDTADASRKGPPFSIHSDDWLVLMAANFELVEDRAVEDSIAVFAGKERWQIWKRR
ncbi:MAG: methyltransferase domain-containing protein [Burkholderiales bacterium]|nr:methyltransferase domain-containing protein [Burkholderiales bacterium]